LVKFVVHFQDGTIIAIWSRVKRHPEYDWCASGNGAVDGCGSEIELPALNFPPLHHSRCDAPGVYYWNPFLANG
jgi:hypothetical protein